MMKQNNVRGRFAPSPSGRLHLGNMVSSLLAWLDVRSLGGEMVFRLEDLDPDRSVYEYSCRMAEDLEWFGLDWDIGWRPGEHPEYAQSNRTELYERMFARFEARSMIYPCYCSRAQRLAASAPHPGEVQDAGCGCIRLTPHERLTQTRLPSYKVHVDSCTIDFTDGHYGPQQTKMIAGADDFIVRRADGVFAYQFAVSYDDAIMGINRVVRGKDLLSSTPKQIWLIQQMGYEVPVYCHAPLMVAADGRKMSKRNGDLSMEVLRNTHTPEHLCGKLAYLAGLLDWPEPVTPTELIPIFTWNRVPTENMIIPEGLF